MSDDGYWHTDPELDGSWDTGGLAGPPDDTFDATAGQAYLGSDPPDADNSVLGGAFTAVAGWAGLKFLRNRIRSRDDEPATAAGKPARAFVPPRPETSAPPPATPSPSPVLAPPHRSEPPDAERVRSERATLVELCVQLDDLLRSDALREKVRRRLREAGVEVLDPTGAVFDPELHDAVGSAPAPTPTDHHRIESVQRVGFADNGAVLRRPAVVVYLEDSR